MLAVCGKATAAANPYQDIPPGILYPSVPVPPIITALSGPAPYIGISTENRSRRRRGLLQQWGTTNDDSAMTNAANVTSMMDEPSVTPQALCINAGNPAYNQEYQLGRSVCHLSVFKLNGGETWCTATFIRPDMVLTAAACLVNTAGRYDIDPTNPGKMT